MQHTGCPVDGLTTGRRTLEIQAATAGGLDTPFLLESTQ